MAPFSEIFYHIVWKTGENSPKMTSPTQRLIENFLAGAGKKFGYSLVAAAVLEDHIHLFVRALPGVAPGDLVLRLKNEIDDFLRQKLAMASPPVWDEDYGVVSVSRSHAELVAEYVKTQRQRHKSGKINRTLERTGT